MLQKFYNGWKVARITALTIGVGIMGVMGCRCEAWTLEIEDASWGGTFDGYIQEAHEQDIRDSIDRCMQGTGSERDIGNLIEGVERGILNRYGKDVKKKYHCNLTVKLRPIIAKPDEE